MVDSNKQIIIFELADGTRMPKSYYLYSGYLIV